LPLDSLLGNRKECHMPGLITTCGKCGVQFSWDSDYQEMPDCPKCGYNPKRQYQQSDISGLVRMLKSSDRYERNHAAAELGNRGDPAAVDPLIAALNDADPIVVLPAVIALGRIGDERAVDPLMKILRTREGACSSAALSLARIGAPRGIQAVVKDIEAVDYKSQRDVFSALLSMGPSVIQFIIPLLKKTGRNDSRYIREYTASVLAQLGWQPPDETERIGFFVNAGQWDKLKEIGPTAVVCLTSALSGAGNEDIVRFAPLALEKLGWSPSTEEDIMAYLRGGGKEGALVRAGAAAVKPLVEALKDSDKTIRNTVAKALCGIADPIGLFPVIMSDIDDELRDKAAMILCRTPTPDTVDQFIDALSNSNVSIQHSAAVALGDIGDPRAVGPLLRALNMQNGRFYVICVALGKLRDPRAVLPLMKIVSGKWMKNDHNRGAAVEALGELRDPRAVDILRVALSDSNSNVSLIAAALANIGDPRAVAPLKSIIRKKKLYDFERETVTSAVNTILKLHPEAATKWWQFPAVEMRDITSNKSRLIFGIIGAVLVFISLMLVIDAPKRAAESANLQKQMEETKQREILAAKEAEKKAEEAQSTQSVTGGYLSAVEAQGQTEAQKQDTRGTLSVTGAYESATVAAGERISSNRNYQIVKVSSPLTGAILVRRRQEQIGNGLAGEVVVSKRCNMFVAVMTVYSGSPMYRSSVLDRQQMSNLLDGTGWRILDDEFSTTTTGSEHWEWTVIGKEIEPGPVTFDLLPCAKVFMFKDL